MEYKEMTDTELAQIMVNYITRTEHLCRLISNYLDGSDRGAIPAERIKEEYKQLKYELRDDAHYLDLSKNRKGSKLYMFFFSPSIREASAFGFCIPVTGTINFALYSAVEEAHYKLGKYHSLEEWGSLM